MSLGVSGKYRLDRRLGGGGMAEVFIGSTMGAEGFSRQVAIKRVLPGYSDNPGFAQMFVSEAQISSKLVHPNIVSVLDFDRDADGRLFLVMELVDGKDLDTLLATGPLPLPAVIYVIGEVLRGLGFAHDLPNTTSDSTGMRGIVHRDVSPHNVLLSWEGSVKVSDFGIAKARAASEATASVFIKGKPAYMSPEQANGQRLDGRSDLFAVGVMLWEMIVGHRLFVAEDTRATLAAVLFGQIPRPRTIRPEIPKDLERVTMKLLERDLPARYATAEEAIVELMNCADAPRAGRELMTAVLSERFTAEAPVRQSVARARSLGMQPTPVPGALAAPGLATMTAPGHAAHGAPSLPGLGTMRGALTGTLEIPRRRGLMAAAGILIAGGVGVAAFFIVSATRDKGAAPAGVAPASVVPANGGSAGRDVPHDAPAAPPLDAGVSIDAAVVMPVPSPAPVIDAGTDPGPGSGSGSAAPAPHATAVKRQGQLVVHAFPTLTVSVDGHVYGDTPRTITLAAGKHRVALKNSASDTTENTTVVIPENQTITIDRMPK